MTIAPSQSKLTLPDHTQLSETDGTFVKNFQEHPQSLLLTDSIRPIFDALHPSDSTHGGRAGDLAGAVHEPDLTLAALMG